MEQLFVIVKDGLVDNISGDTDEYLTRILSEAGINSFDDALGMSYEKFDIKLQAIGFVEPWETDPGEFVYERS